MADKHEEKLLDHEVDGIQELDNPLPSWWLYLFYVSIVFAIAYGIYFTFMRESSHARIDQTVAAMREQKQQKAFTQAGAGVELADFEPNMELGLEVFKSKCAPCHGQNGEGVVGPNLTDNYWVHGKGTVQDIYQVVVTGVPEKGMISWEPLLSEEEMRSVAAYVKSLVGTQPNNPKDPQGTLIE